MTSRRAGPAQAERAWPPLPGPACHTPLTVRQPTEITTKFAQEPLYRLVPKPADERLQLRDDLDAALVHLREVRDRYWDHDWRREHRGHGRYPENELWEAVEGFLDLADASRSGKPDT